MSRGLKISQMLIANMSPFVNISNFSSKKDIFVMVFRVTRWDTLDVSLTFLYAW